MLTRSSFNFRRCFRQGRSPREPEPDGKPDNLGVPYTYLVPAYKGVTKVDDMTVRVDLTPNPVRACGPSVRRRPSSRALNAVAGEGEGIMRLSPGGHGSVQGSLPFEPKPSGWELVPQRRLLGSEAGARIGSIAIIKTDPAALVNDLLSGNIDAMVCAAAGECRPAQGGELCTELLTRRSRLTIWALKHDEGAVRRRSGSPVRELGRWTRRASQRS